MTALPEKVGFFCMPAKRFKVAKEQLIALKSTFVLGSVFCRRIEKCSWKSPCHIQENLTS